VHLHPRAVLLPDAVGERVRSVATDHAYDLWRVVTVPFAMPGSVELAETAAAMAADGTDFLRARPPWLLGTRRLGRAGA
jgi:hypothetical protein